MRMFKKTVQQGRKRLKKAEVEVKVEQRFSQLISALA